jgi:hypothetical protein
MIEWKRLNPEAEEGAVLEAVSSYRIGPGEARFYGPGLIHSTEHPEKAWVIRVIGTDLDSIPRYHFNPKTDRMVESAE